VFGKVGLGVYYCEDDQEDQAEDTADCDTKKCEPYVVFIEVVAGQPDVFEGCEEGV